MGGTSSTSSTSTYRKLLDDYQLIQQSKQQGLSYLESKSSQQQYLLREMSSPDSQTHKKTYELLLHRQQQLQDNRHITSLKKIVQTVEDQFCITSFKVYALWQFPQRTLEDQINQRAIQKRRFQEKELWSILASCILGMSHLQKQDIRHNALKSGAILISPDGFVKLFDPLATGTPTNYDKLLMNRSKPHLYLSPEQTDSLRQQRTFPCCDPYKTDIWTLGMILLQAGLLSYQDECYRQQYSRIHYQTLQYNINRFTQGYSAELANLLQFMLAKNQLSRPDWAELEEHVIKVEEDHGGSGVGERGREVERVASFGRDGGEREGKGEGEVVGGGSGRTEKLLIFDKKPLSYSKVEPFEVKTKKKIQLLQPSQTVNYHQPPHAHQSPTAKHIPQNIQHQKQLQQLQQPRQLPQLPPPQPQPFRQSLPIFRPSDITTRRPLRNIFPLSSYTTHTKIDQHYTIQQPQNTISSPSQPDPSFHPQAQYVKQVYTQGSRYQGYKVNGVKNGAGRFYYQDGGMYDGNWVEGKMHGIGRLYYQSGKLAYEGEWKNDQFWGAGVLHNECPEQLTHPFDYRNFNTLEQFWIKYEGDFRADMKDGKGRLYLTNGELFEGFFKQDYLQGRGVFSGKRGRTEGVWRKNVME